VLAVLTASAERRNNVPRAAYVQVPTQGRRNRDGAWRPSEHADFAMPGDVRVSDPFEIDYRVPVAGGELRVARSGPPADQAGTVVLAIHGVASSHMIWRGVARELNRDGRTCVLAPDLRGRGRSIELPGPFGMAAHAADLLAVLDDAGVTEVVLLGHSLGAYVATTFASLYPERTSAAVLLDGGLAIPSYPDAIAGELIDAMVDTALEYARVPFESVAEHVAQWRRHPALEDAWDEDTEAYARYDVAETDGSLHAAVTEAAVRADIGDLVLHESARAAIERVRAPLLLMRARNGLEAGSPAMMPQPLIDAFSAGHPHAKLIEVAGANHYTLVLGAGDGPRCVAAVVAAAITTAT
jgi:lipase